jgi:hypothetical protein
MPSFDIVNRIDMQTVDDAVNNANREIGTRYDFRGSTNEIKFNRAENKINFLAADKMKMNAMREIFIANVVRQKIETKSFKYGDPEDAAGGAIRKEVLIQEGIEKELAQKIVKLIKGTKIKVQAAIQKDELRVSGKKIDDLQAVMTFLKEQDIEIPLQFINMRS